MHTNPFNPRLACRSRIPFKDDYPVVIRSGVNHRGVWFERFVWCGLKGKMALGDAHPYLALFYLEMIIRHCQE